MGTANFQSVHMNEADIPVQSLPDPASRSRRIALIDVVRGVALIAMAIFHGAWDVAYFRLIRFDPGESLGWTLFARSIAATFLIVSGVSLVLATRNGIRWKSYSKRLGMIVGAAALVSVATYFVMGRGWVFFGILHEIAVASVLALPFLQLPLVVVALVSAFFIGLPFLFRSEVFDLPALWWAGLAPTPPPSFDYVPLFPWFGAFLAGVALARFALARGWDQRLAAWSPRRWPGRLLALGGRHSLLVYLVHQPILFGFFFVVANVLLPGTAEKAARADCQDSCVAQGLSAGECEAYCRCAFDEAKSAGLLSNYLANKSTDEELGKLRGTFLACQAKTIRPRGDEPPAADTSP